MTHFKPASWISSAIVAGAALLAGNAQAAQIYATDVVYYNTNGTRVSASRQNLDSALGAPQLASRNTDFLSLGMGGRAVFDFGQSFSGGIRLWETTWGNHSDQDDYDERVNVYYGNFGSVTDLTDWQTLAYDMTQWVAAGNIHNIEHGAFNAAAGATNARDDFELPDGIFTHVLLVDDSQRRADGFDVNAIAVNGVDRQEVPEPASALGLVILGTVGGACLRKRKAA